MPKIGNCLNFQQHENKIKWQQHNQLQWQTTSSTTWGSSQDHNEKNYVTYHSSIPNYLFSPTSMPLISSCLPFTPFHFYFPYLFIYWTSSTSIFVVLNPKDERKKKGMQYCVCYCVLCSLLICLLTLFYTSLHGV